MSPSKKKRKSRNSSARRKKKAAARAQQSATARPATQPHAATSNGTQHPRLHLSAVDTWFFRESRPHNAVGASELSSLFPPPAATIAGALRTAIGDAQGADWHRFGSDTEYPLRQLIGFGDDLGPLRIDGPWLNLKGNTLFPAPAFLLARNSAGQTECQRLRPGPAANTDLGRVHLPQMPDSARDFKPMSNNWIDSNGMARILAGRIPSANQIHPLSDLCSDEPRLGIARDRHTRSVDPKKGMLYQTRHRRPHPALSIELGLTGLPAEHQPANGTLLRLGGEGRLASLNSHSAADPVELIKPAIPTDSKSCRLILILLTAADLDGGWLPPGFTPDQPDGSKKTQSWSGQLNGIALRIRAAALGRAQRQGGWDQAAGQPRPVRSLLPAGSSWYCDIIDDSDLQTAIDALHGSQLPPANDNHGPQQLGYGRLAAGLWPTHEQPVSEHTP